MGMRGFEATMSQKRAREIMGHNMFDVEEAIRHLGINPSRTQLATLSEVPLTEAVLEEHRDTDILTAVLPFSIIDVREKIGKSPSLASQNRDWYNRQVFATERGGAEWKLIRKTPITNSIGETWLGQQALLANNEETPTARVMIYMIVGHFIVTGERLFDKIYVRCADRGSVNFRIVVGYFDSSGPNVVYALGSQHNPYVGIASVVKSKQSREPLFVRRIRSFGYGRI